MISITTKFWCRPTLELSSRLCSYLSSAVVVTVAPCTSIIRRRALRHEDVRPLSSLSFSSPSGRTCSSWWWWHRQCWFLICATIPERPRAYHHHMRPVWHSHHSSRGLSSFILILHSLLLLASPSSRAARLIRITRSMAPPAPEKEPEQGVRFSNINKEIEPDVNLDHPTDTHSNPRARPDVPPQVQQELRDLTISMQTSQLQAKRMANFAYEPMSLPPSRVRMVQLLQFLPYRSTRLLLFRTRS